jgi:pimeloyl-ACP methyl ester carboxylesterase
MLGGMESIPHPDGGHLAADVDRRDPMRWWICVHGFGSDRSGTKVTTLRAAAAVEGSSFLAFDARGHGQSSGSMADVTMSRFVEDVDVAVEAVVPADADLLVIGSSLGGLATAWWTVRRPGRALAAVLVAPAFGFIERFLDEMGPAETATWEREGVLHYRNAWMQVPLGWAAVLDSRTHDDASLARAYRTDTTIVHGLHDEGVPWQVSAAFVQACPHRPLDLLLLGDGDHRLQGRMDALTSVVRAMSAGITRPE